MKKFTPETSFSDGENVSISGLLADHDTPEHMHEFVELVYIRSGTGRHIINGHLYEVTKGDLLFINFGSVHAIEASDAEFVNILLKPEFMSDNLVNSENIFDIFALSRFDSISGEYNGLDVVSFRGEELVTIDSIVNAMTEEYTHKKNGYKTVLYGCFQVMFAMMIRKLREKHTEEYSRFVSHITSYIDEHIAEKLTLKDIAADCFYNPSYFSCKFKECYGKNLTEYLREKRLNKAAYMLENTQLSVDDILGMCGFSGKTQFYRMFSERYGLTPLSYRKSKK